MCSIFREINYTKVKLTFIINYTHMLEKVKLEGVNNMKKVIFLCFLFFVTPLTFFAQNFNQLNELIETEKISLGQVSYLVASSINLDDENLTYDSAFEKMKEKGYFAEGTKSTDFVTVKKLCGFLAKAYNCSGGLFFTISKKSDRYAFREFVAKGFIPKDIDPMGFVSGIDAIGLLSNLLEGK